MMHERSSLGLTSAVLDAMVYICLLNMFMWGSNAACFAEGSDL